MRMLYLLTIFVSSFLLFLVQPMMAKAILPLAGGAPAVWIVTMLFFQILLLGGYGYAAFTSARLSPRRQSEAHLALYILALFVSVPLALHTPDFNTAERPEIWVMITLLFSIGMPYFVLSAHSSLLQRWYHHHFNLEPYHLFSASNVGSLLGLFGYPFLVEWLLPLSDQMQYWGWGFLLVAVLIALISGKQPSSDRIQSLGKSLPRLTAAKVVLAGFVPSSLFLGVTLHVTTDIASLPLLWIIPLALYLISFILVFSAQGERLTALAQKLHPLALLIALVGAMGILNHWAILASFLAFFVIAVSCHGQAMRLKPPANALTSYYFWLSFGGALGGLFNTLAPHLFTSVLEYPIIVLLSILVLPAKFSLTGSNRLPLKKAGAVGVMMLVAIGFIYSGDSKDQRADNIIHQSRNFFGVSKVVRYPHYTEYMHGTTTHGIQAKDDKYRLHPVSYYGPVKKLIERLPPAFFEHPFAVLGLGAGTVACYGHKDQPMDFFEIDQAVVDIAQNPDYFTYLRDCPPQKNIIMGDGRIELAKQPDHRYSLIVLDAFTSDAVPMHLLTKEALGMYMAKTAPDVGILAFDVSNRHLSLAPFIARAAKEHGWLSYHMLYQATPKAPFQFSSEWVIVVPPSSLWLEQLMLAGLKPVEIPAATSLWSDDYSNILPAIKWSFLK